uniref:hypothetical protein n=1 Tax=Streptacidiphilus anmyonensis TaxID=405782 RepID=UPI0005A95A3C
MDQENFIAPTHPTVSGGGVVTAPLWHQPGTTRSAGPDWSVGAVWPTADPAPARTLLDILDETAW